jgi:hypothetical protein
MKTRYTTSLLAPIALVAAAPCQAEVYFSLEQVQQSLFPGEVLAPQAVILSPQQMQAIEDAAGVPVREPRVHAWKSASGGWLLVDKVIGKHDYITYAVALDAAGAVRQVEVMEYRESYGGEIRNARWRAQFAGKKPGAPLRIDRDIRNMAGATLSSVHVTEGVRRLLATHAVALARF